MEIIVSSDCRSPKQSVKLFYGFLICIPNLYIILEIGIYIEIIKNRK